METISKLKITLEEISEEDLKVGYLQSRIKRIIDIVGAIIGIIFLWPLLIPAIIIIRFIDRVPPIFHQERIGLGGFPFVLNKLRSLTVVETSEMINVQSVERKPHYKPTLTGKLWRVTSIDELPQFWNVLKGEMSLVGHRPFPYYYIPLLYELPNLEKFHIEVYLRVLALHRPGITSISSVRGRSKLSIQEKMICDLEYAQRAGLLLDVSILIRSVKTVITMDGVQ